MKIGKSRFCNIGPGLVRVILTKGLYYKTLRIHKLWQMARFISTLGSYIVDHKHTNFDKLTSLQRNLYITDM
jgi:hypothetical protein